jgi:capsular polysaccharide export protein
LPKPYIFFPLQVSTDQQVLVNYAGASIFKAIDEVVEYARNINTALCFREHPAESQSETVKSYIKKICESERQIYVSSDPVSRHIDECSEIITINSTVGLEGLINNKKVRFIGKSLYLNLNKSQIADYLNNYLVEVDYHNPKLSKKLIEKIFSKLYK